jgi:hypothetical protein
MMLRTIGDAAAWWLLKRLFPAELARPEIGGAVLLPRPRQTGPASADDPRPPHTRPARVSRLVVLRGQMSKIQGAQN